MIKQFVFLSVLTAGTAALADAPTITKVEASRAGMGWRFDVTLAHPDTGWDHYADGWELIDDAGNQIAEVRVERFTEREGGRRSPVTVGAGGSTGSYGSGVGLGVGINLGGGSGVKTATEMGVVIRDRTTGDSIWEGRASFVVDEKSPLAGTDLGAAAMAEALFADFPGNDGETVRVEVAD